MPDAPVRAALALIALSLVTACADASGVRDNGGLAGGVGAPTEDVRAAVDVQIHMFRVLLGAILRHDVVHGHAPQRLGRDRHVIFG